MRSLRLNQEVEVFIAGIAAAQSFLLSIYSFFERKRDFKNLLLSIFFLAITIRLGKSILWIYLDDSPLWLINLGFMAHAISGPALFLYTLYFLLAQKWSKWNLLHFVPAVFLALGSNFLTLEGFWYQGGYSTLLIQQLLYSGLTLFVLFAMPWSKKSQHRLSRAAKVWICALVVGTTVWQLLYFSNYFLGLTPYLLGPVIYLPFIYFLAFLQFKNPSLLKQRVPAKQQNIRLSKEELLRHSKQLEDLLRDTNMFLDPNCTLSTVADAMKLPPYLISHIVNNGIGKSFPNFLNGHRIEEVKQRLKTPDYQSIKIANIAYDCGFNSLSSFNAAFKKVTGTTPSAYLKHVASVKQVPKEI